MGFASHVELWRKGMKANARQMRKAKRGKRVGEKEGNEKGKQPSRRRPPLPFSPLSVCVLPVCPSSRCTRCSERATSLARSPTTGLLPMCEEKCVAGVGLDPYRGAKQCIVSACAFFSLSFVRSSLFTVGKASRWIRVNAVRLTLIRRRFNGGFIPHRAASSLFDAKPLSIYIYTSRLRLVRIIYC